MGVLCLSLAPVLRCVSLTTIQSGVLLIPPGFEALFCLALVLSKRWSSDAIHLLIAAEGFTYFIGSLLDFLTHTIPAARASLKVFKTLDIVLGSLNLAPLLLYTIFLFLTVQSELLQYSFPVRVRSVVRYTLALFIPLIFITSAIGSFIGISYREIPTPDRPLTLVVGFPNDSAKLLWSSFGKLALGLYTIYQALNFLLFFSRTMHVLRDQSSLEGAGSDFQNHSFGGVGYMTLGLKLGTIETLVGFTTATFGETVARRTIRLLGRVFLIVGLIKGWDILEDFTLQARRRSKHKSLLGPISNPILSSFRHVTGGPEFTIAYPRMSRVTVHTPEGHAPILKLHLSDIEQITGVFSRDPGTGPMTTKDIVSTPNLKYHHYPQPDPQNSAAATNSPTNSDGQGIRGSKSMAHLEFTQVLQTISKARRESSNSTESAMWLTRPVNVRPLPSPGSQLRSFVFSDPRPPVSPISEQSSSPGGPRLTSRWTATTVSMSPTAGLPSPPQQLSQYGNSVKAIPWSGPHPSRQDDDVPSFKSTKPISRHSTSDTATLWSESDQTRTVTNLSEPEATEMSQRPDSVSVNHSVGGPKLEFEMIKLEREIGTSMQQGLGWVANLQGPCAL